MLVVLAHPVPRELDLDPSQLVGPDVLALGTDDHRRLRAVGVGLGVGGLRAQGLAHGVGRQVHLHTPRLRSVRPRILVLAVLAHVLDQEVGVQHQVFGVGPLAGVLLELEGAPRHHAAQVAAGFGPGPVGAQLLHAQSGQMVPFGLGVVGLCGARPGLGVVAARTVGVPLVDLAIVPAGGARVLAAGAQVGSGAGVVVVPGAVPSAGDLVVGDEGMEVLGIELPARGVVLDLLVGRTRVGLVAAQVVDEDQAVLAVAVLEEVVDAPFLAEALEEGQVALVELGLVVPGRIGFDEALVDGEGVVAEQFIEDCHRALVLEDPAVGAQGGQVQPGAQDEAVLDVAAFFAPERRFGDEGVDLPGAGTDAVHGGSGGTGQEFAGAVQFDEAVDLPADEGVEVEVGGAAGSEVQSIGCLEQQFVLEQAVQAFPAGEAYRLQGGLPRMQRNGIAADAKRAREHAAKCGHGKPPWPELLWQCLAALGPAPQTILWQCQGSVSPALARTRDAIHAAAFRSR